MAAPAGEQAAGDKPAAAADGEAKDVAAEEGTGGAAGAPNGKGADAPTGGDAPTAGGDAAGGGATGAPAAADADGGAKAAAEAMPTDAELVPIDTVLITPTLTQLLDMPSPPPRAAANGGADAGGAAKASGAGGAPKHGAPKQGQGSRKRPAGKDDDGGGDAAGGKRPRLVWTPQLHRRFVDAVQHLGINAAVPKTIMQLMNVEGLTRENVASHLQKYRLYLKRLSNNP